jgi:hypothetical protein
VLRGIVAVRALDRAGCVGEDTIRRELSKELSGAQVLRRAVKGAVESIEGCDHAGVSLRSHHGEVQTPVWTSPAVWAADAMQFALNEGPSLEPMSIADYVIVDNLGTNQRWPRWAPEVVKLDLRSLISIRLPGGSQSFAALNLYSSCSYGFGPRALLQGCSYAVDVLDTIQAAGLATGFESDMASRCMIAMAQGVMKYRYGFEPSRSLSLLQSYSVKSHVDLREAAREFVDAGRDVSGTRG